MCHIGGIACVAIRFPPDAVSRPLRIQIWILTAVGGSDTDLPPFSRVTSGWLTSGYSQLASARTHPPHCRQEAAVPPRAVRGCPPRLPCRARAPSPSTCIFTARRCMPVATNQPVKSHEPIVAKPHMHTPCSSCRSSAPDAPLPSQLTPPLPAVSWRTSVPLASQRPSPKTTIHMLKLGRIARRGAANKCTG